MKKLRLISVLIALFIIAANVLTVFAADSNVTYSGNAGDFIFAPGSEYSPTDLFANYKDLMPGASIEQKITIKNNADDKIKIVVYLRSSGEADGNTKNFLKQLKLTVKVGDTTYFDASADKTADLTEWTSLGTIYSGGTVDMNLILTVPTTLDNEFQNSIGKIKWEFKVEEYPAQDEPTPGPSTGDTFNVWLWVIVLIVCAAVVTIVIFILLRKKKKSEDDTDK